MLSVEKVATPLTAATAPPPVSVPPPGFVPIARVTFPVKVVAVFPAASSAVTRTAGVIAAPAVVLLGGTVNTSWVGVTVVILNCGLFTPVNPLDVARRRYPLPALLIDRSENVATPPTAATVFVPETVPATGLPAPSRTSTEGGEATVVPTVADCEVGLLLVIVAAAPALSVIAAVTDVRSGAPKLKV